MLYCSKDPKGNNHGTVWFHGDKCPVCEALNKQAQEHDLTLSLLEDQIARLKCELDAIFTKQDE